jgi:hypothetical protein
MLVDRRKSSGEKISIQMIYDSIQSQLQFHISTPTKTKKFSAHTLGDRLNCCWAFSAADADAADEVVKPRTLRLCSTQKLLHVLERNARRVTAPIREKRVDSSCFFAYRNISFSLSSQFSDHVHLRIAIAIAIDDKFA